jgi:hypothetical protein
MATEPKPLRISLDTKNSNLGTERGQKMLVESLKKYGAGRSVLLDKNGRLIAGNKTYKAAKEAGAVVAIKVVQSDGHDVIAVKRMDLDLHLDPNARALAYADNRISEINLQWDTQQLIADIEGGLDIGQFWFDDELAKLLAGSPGELEPGGAGEAGDTPDFGNNPNSVKMVQLFLNDGNYPAFIQQANALMESFGKDNLTDTVLEALQREAALVPAEVDTGGARRINLG